VRVLDIRKKNFFVPNLVVFSFLEILESLSAKILQDLHETTFVRSSDAIKDVHMDSVIIVQLDVILHKGFFWNQALCTFIRPLV